MRKEVSLIISGLLSIDIEIDEQLSVEELINELQENRVINTNLDSKNYIINLLLKKQIISFKTQLSYYKIDDNEIIYIEKRGV